MTLFSDSLRAFLKPVVPFLDDPEVAEVLINGPKEIWVEKRGQLILTQVQFSEEGLLAAARNMAQYVGRPLSEERPRLDARMPDGSRIHVVLAPVARRGTTISIRKFFAERLTIDKLLELGTLSKKMARLLEGVVSLKRNVVVSGGTSSGKTSMLNVLSQFIGSQERILTLEDSAELQLNQPHVVGFESRPADKLGKGQVDIGDLLNSALRLRPDRIVVGEVRGGECFHLLQAMNTGHGGTLTTAHANTPVDTLRRLESLCLMSGIDMPLRAIRAQVASAVSIVVCCERFSDGSRKLTKISEVLPLDEQGEYRAQDLVEFEQTGRDGHERIVGRFVWTGVKPSFFAKLAPGGFADVQFEKSIEEVALPEFVPLAQEEKPHDTDPKAVAPVHAPAPPRAKPAPLQKPKSNPPPPALAKEQPKPHDPKSHELKPPEPKSPELKPPELKSPEPIPSIQLAPDLEREVQARLPNESTLITRNPLHRPRPTDEDTNPNARRRS